MSLLTNNPELRARFESDAFLLISELQETLAALSQPTPDHAHIVTLQDSVMSRPRDALLTSCPTNSVMVDDSAFMQWRRAAGEGPPALRPSIR